MTFRDRLDKSALRPAQGSGTGFDLIKEMAIHAGCGATHQH
ncbi:MAG: hypothetical protein AAF941_06985 [Pseudomonadota bacterium]